MQSITKRGGQYRKGVSVETTSAVSRVFSWGMSRRCEQGEHRLYENLMVQLQYINLNLDKCTYFSLSVLLNSTSYLGGFYQANPILSA